MPLWTALAHRTICLINRSVLTRRAYTGYERSFEVAHGAWWARKAANGLNCRRIKTCRALLSYHCSLKLSEVPLRGGDWGGSPERAVESFWAQTRPDRSTRSGLAVESRSAVLSVHKVTLSDEIVASASHAVSTGSTRIRSHGCVISERI